MIFSEQDRWTRLAQFTADKMPEVHRAAREQFRAGAQIENLVGIISNGGKVPAMATVVTREAFGFPKALALFKSQDIVAQFEARDPNTLLVVTFFEGEVMVTPVPVTIVEVHHG